MQVAVARAFTVAVMRVLEFDDDRVTAVRLAVSELVTELVLAGADELGLEFGDGLLRLEVLSPSLPPGPPLLDDRRREMLRLCLDRQPSPNSAGGWDLPLEVSA